MTANEKRAKVRDKYKTILGRNKYSQDRRNYVFKKYSNGYYYSDCSSSIAACYREVGYPIAGNSLPNTVGLYQSKNLTDVPVVIKKGVIQNPEVLRVGDMLLFAGTDTSRAYAGYVGHVEMVANISGSKVTIYGHGSGTPRATEMNAYCKSRYSKKTNTKLGHRGLIKVRRLIQDDGSEGTSVVTDLHNGSTGSAVKQLQKDLISIGYSCGSNGADGDFGSDTEKALKAFQKDHALTQSGVYDKTTQDAMKKVLGADSDSVSTDSPPLSPVVVIANCQKANIRSGPSTDYASVGIANVGDKFRLVEPGEWKPVIFNGKVVWVSGKYSTIEG